MLGAALLMGSLMITACNKDASKESSKEQSKSQASTQQPASTGSQQQSTSGQQQSTGGQQQSTGGQATTSQGGGASEEKSVEVTALVFEKKADNKVYIKASGTQTGYTASNFVWVWGILTGGNQQGQGQGGETELTDDAFIYGKAAPTAADGTVVAFDANKAFTAELCLTTVIGGITDFKPALYTIYGGTVDTYAAIVPTDAQSTASDTDYKYYVRDDQFCIAIDKIPDVAFETATVSVPTGLAAGKTEGIYVKIGGTVKAGVNIADLEVAADFQRIGQYSKHNIDNETEFYWTTEGNKAYMNLYIGFMEAGEQWMTHLGFNVPETTTWWGGTEKNIPNCYMDNDINDVSYEFSAQGKKVTVNAKASEGQGGTFYGCLGFTIEAL